MKAAAQFVAVCVGVPILAMAWGVFSLAYMGALCYPLVAVAWVLDGGSWKVLYGIVPSVLFAWLGSWFIDVLTEPGCGLNPWK